MHRSHHMERGYVVSGPLLGHHEFRNDADHPTVSGKAGVRHHLHQADIAATIDQPQPTRGEFFAQEPGHLGVPTTQAGTGAAKHTHVVHGDLRNSYDCSSTVKSSNE